MSKTATLSGTIHTLPTDISTALEANKKLLTIWNNLTPLARNEWICWVTIVKKPETTKNHIDRLQIELLEGKRRPCCWPGCPHHNPMAKKWFS
jgi:uncharacterized protein YdeI (YjbR/CyaY-like superfamily)